MAKLVDAHIHFGGSVLNDVYYPAQRLIDNMNENGIDVMMVTSYAEAKGGYAQAHKDIYELTQKAPGKIFGIANVAVRHDAETYEKEVTHCINDFGFVGIKLDTSLGGTYPLYKVSDKAFQVADKLNVPLMVHTGLGVSWSPAMLLRRAREYPNLKIVLCHAGGRNYSDEALFAAQLCDNIYLAPTYCAIHFVRKMINALPDRVIVSSDVIENTKNVLYEAGNIEMMQEIREKYLGETALKLFGINAN